MFKTPDTSGFLELGALVQALTQVSGNAAQPVNQNAVVSVVRVLANEHRELMVDRREAGIYKQVKLLTNPMSSSSLVSRRGIEMFSTFLSSRCWDFKRVKLTVVWTPVVSGQQVNFFFISPW